MSDIEWRSKAACRFPEKYGLDAEDWFPLPSQPARDVKRVCLDCPVRKDCASEAKDFGQHGIWAGFSMPKQRRSLRQYLSLGDATAEHDEANKPNPVVGTCVDCGSDIRTKFRSVRCRPCLLSNARQEPRVLIGVIRPHLLGLRALGWTNRGIAAACGVHHQIINEVVAERALSVSRDAANKLLAVEGNPPARKPGMCPGCGKEKPIMSASPKSGLRGHCSKKCRDASAVNA